MENYSEALDSLLEGNALYDSDVRLLNSLGFCYYKVGQKAEALEALRASLSLNPEQPKIQALIEEIEKNNQ
jgi:Flp pilus assembly protein TadD